MVHGSGCRADLCGPLRLGSILVKQVQQWGRDHPGEPISLESRAAASSVRPPQPAPGLPGNLALRPMGLHQVEAPAWHPPPKLASGPSLESVTVQGSPPLGISQPGHFARHYQAVVFGVSPQPGPERGGGGGGGGGGPRGPGRGLLKRGGGGGGLGGRSPCVSDPGNTPASRWAHAHHVPAALPGPRSQRRSRLPTAGAAGSLGPAFPLGVVWRMSTQAAAGREVVPLQILRSPSEVAKAANRRGRSALDRQGLIASS